MMKGGGGILGGRKRGQSLRSFSEASHFCLDRVENNPVGSRNGTVQNAGSRVRQTQMRLLAPSSTDCVIQASCFIPGASVSLSEKGSNKIHSLAHCLGL